MKKGLIITMMLTLTTTMTRAEQVVIQTRNNSLVLEVEKGKQPRYVYYGDRLSEQEPQHL